MDCSGLEPEIKIVSKISDVSPKNYFNKGDFTYGIIIKKIIRKRYRD